MSEEDFIRLLTAKEPADMRSYLALVESGKLYAEGTSVPLIRPDFAPIGPGSVHVPSGTAPAPIDYVATYLTLGEYIDIPPGENGAETLARLSPQLLQGQSKEELLVDLCALNWATRDKDRMADVQARYSGLLRADVRDRLEGAMRNHEGKRTLLSRQAVMRAIRHVLITEFDETANRLAPTLSAAILLTHAIASTLAAERANPELLTPTISAASAMEILRNAHFYETDDVYSLIDRHMHLWRDYGGSLVRQQPRALPIEMLQEATGLTLEELLGFGFALYAHVNGWEPGKPPLLNRDLGSDLGVEKLKAFAHIFARTPEEHALALREADSRWNFLAFEQHPVIELQNGWLIIDPVLAMERATRGLYWLVHDHERDQLGDKERDQWTHVYAEMVELQAEDVFRAIAPPVIGGGISYFSEEEFLGAYGAEGSNPDAVIDFGHAIILAEVVSGWLHTKTRHEGDVHQFKKDAERFILKKARQLDEAGRKLMNDPGRLCVSAPKTASVVPVIVVGGGWPAEPLTGVYVEETLADEGLFTDARFGPVCVITPSELTMLEALQEHRGLTPIELLREWKESGLHRVSLKNFLLTGYPPASPEVSRPSRMKNHVDTVMKEIIPTLKLRDKREDDDTTPSNRDSGSSS